jgi:hypothetical protein
MTSYLDPKHFLVGKTVYEPGKLPLPLRQKIAAALSTRLTNLANTQVVLVSDIRPFVHAAVITSYGRVEIQSGGDTIRTASARSANAADSRDATFVRVRVPHSHRMNADSSVV